MQNFLTFMKAYWSVWIWNPLTTRLTKLFGINDCCDNPDWIWNEGHGFTIRYCNNCKRSRTYPRNF